MQGEIFFVTSGLKRGAQSRLGEYLDFDRTDLPLLVVFQQKDQLLQYRYTSDVKEISVADVKKFVTDFKAGSLKPFLKSEEVPLVEEEEGMTTIVANTFDRIVNDPTKEVLVFYFVEWCAHAVSLEGTWADLAYDVKEIDDVNEVEVNEEVTEVEEVLLVQEVEDVEQIEEVE